MSGRDQFNTTWLVETPSTLGEFGNTFDILSNSINDWINNGIVPTQIKPNLFTLHGQNIQYFWYQDKNEITLAVELEKRQQGYAVTIVGKNPKYSNKLPYATDLYNEILSVIPLSLIFSDAQLSNDGISLWRKLISDPNNVVSAYNQQTPGKSFKTISPHELDDYIGPDHYYLRFVLSRKGIALAETRSYFNTRRYRELSGMILE